MPRQLTIYKRIFYQSDCYRSGVVQSQTGVQVHSTGANNPYLHRYVAPDDGRIGPNRYGNSSNQPGSNVCASAYIGRMQDGTVAVYQSLPWNYRCWLSGNGPNGNANRLGFVGFEICEDDLTDPQYFAAVMDQAALLSAHLCTIFGFGVDRVADHAELHARGIASGHADIGHWLRKHGFSMGDFRTWVQNALNNGVEVTYVDCDGGDDMTGKVQVSANGYVNVREGPGMDKCAIVQLRPGSLIDAQESSGEWTKVSFTGYIKTEFLKEVK